MGMLLVVNFCLLCVSRLLLVESLRGTDESRNEKCDIVRQKLQNLRSEFQTISL